MLAKLICLRIHLMANAEEISAAAASNVVQLVLVHFSAERVAVYSEDFRGARLISIELFENAADELLLELRQRFFEQNAPLDHRAHQRFQLLFHFSMLRNRLPRTISSRACSRLTNGSRSADSVECVADDPLIGFSIFLLSRHHDFRRKRRRRWLLVPSDFLEVIPHVLLIKRRLRFAGSVLIRGPEARRIRRERFVNPDQFIAQ